MHGATIKIKIMFSRFWVFPKARNPSRLKVCGGLEYLRHWDGHFWPFNSTNSSTETNKFTSTRLFICIGFYRRFRKIAKKTISFVMSVRLAVRMQQLRSHRGEFHEFWYLSFQKSVEKVQFSLKSDKINLYFTWRPINLRSYLPQ